MRKSNVQEVLTNTFSKVLYLLNWRRNTFLRKFTGSKRGNRKQPPFKWQIFTICSSLLLFVSAVADSTAEISSRDAVESYRKLNQTTFKFLPFEPLTRTKHSKKHIGEKWVSFTVQSKDTLYGLIRKNGMSKRDLSSIMQLGREAIPLKQLMPGQKIRIHRFGTRILELEHHQGNDRVLKVFRKNNQYRAVTTLKDHIVTVAIPNPVKSHTAVAIPDPVKSHTAFVDGLSIVNDLDDQPDDQLQAKLEATIKRLGLMNQVKKKKLAIALVDITDNSKPRLAMLNGNEMMYAASLPKIAILLGAFVKVQQGEMALDANTRWLMTQMIRYSSNESATAMLKKVGENYLRNVLTSDHYHFYDRSRNGGLWVGKAYGKSPAFQRDPLHNLSHGATVYQAARFYYLLESGQLVSKELSMEMKNILSKPEIHHKFVKGLKNHPEAKIYRKSGTWRQWHSDSALVEANGYKYIAIALSENQEGGQWLTKMISPLHNLIVPQAFAEL